MEIRTAAVGDLGGILQADHLASHGDAERAELLRHCLNLGEVQVQVDHGSVTGFVIRKPGYFFGRDFIELLMVDPRHRRSGTGRALLQAAVRSAGTDQVFTSTNASNVAMRSLLVSESWSFSGKLDGLDEGDPELVYFTRGDA